MNNSLATPALTSITTAPAARPSHQFSRSGNIWKVIPTAALNIKPQLPPGNYTVQYDIEQGYYLTEVGSFTRPPKLYGDTNRHADRILNTFMSRERSTGVLLSGEKGSGKTLLACELSLRVAEDHGYPTLIVNSPFAGDGFSAFLQAINQPCVVLFDEYEKNYADEETQDRLLTVLDGVYPSKKLFVLTSNDPSRVNKYMLNRPGRIFYRVDYVGLSSDFVREYCEDNLVDKSHLEKMALLPMLFGSLNFDILKALVEDMNRYGESPSQVLELLNAKPLNDFRRTMSLELSYKGTPLNITGTYGVTSVESGYEASVCPTKFNLTLYANTKDFNKDTEDSELFDIPTDNPWYPAAKTDDNFEEPNVDFNADRDLVSVDSDTGVWLYRNPLGYELRLGNPVVPQYSAARHAASMLM